MIQELLGGGSSSLLDLGGERKISSSPINCVGISRVLEGSTISSSPSTLIANIANTATTTTTTTTTTAAPTSDQQNLRCPRCDSSNTKFCYYNNYNLTQPRYFCKTCRRYWTKGGALRNVPIGGGCRKNKSPIVTTTAGKAISVGKIKSVSQDNVKPSLVFGFQDHDSPSNNNPFLWPSQSQTSSQLLALLRGSTQNPNPNSIKEEGNMIGSQMISDHSVVTTGPLNSRSLSLDHTSTTHVPFSLSSSFWRNNENRTPQQQQQEQQQQQQQSFLVGEVQNTGIQELYQRLRSSANYYSDHSPQVLNSTITSQPTNSSSIIEPASTLTGSGELGSYWNPSFAWSNLSTTNGAFP